MSDWVGQACCAAAITLALILLALGMSGAQPTRESALDFYGKDLKEHRDYLETQLAAAKAALADAQQKLAAVKPCPEAVK